MIFLAFAVSAYPGNFLGQGFNIGCYAAVGASYMGGVVDGSDRIQIEFTPELGENNTFVLGQVYTVNITNTGAGMPGRLLGADGGTFGTPSSGCDGSDCGNLKSGFDSCYRCDWNGARTTPAGKPATGWSTCGTNTDDYIITWTAPADGTDNVDFGTSRASEQGYIYTKSIELVNPNGDGPSPTALPPKPDSFTPSPTAFPPTSSCQVLR